jgi:putative ABC transport system permease protein
MKGGNPQKLIGQIEAKWKAMVPDQPFKFLFLDQDINAQYENEKRAGEIFGVFSALAIVIACVGLFGLSAYTASLRTKEIGVRKVLGASVSSVMLLLSKDFARLIILAFVIAVPISWYLMEQWLAGFAYRIQLGAGVFLLAGATALLIALITVSYQSVKAAIVNPIRSLRSE